MTVSGQTSLTHNCDRRDGNNAVKRPRYRNKRGRSLSTINELIGGKMHDDALRATNNPSATKEKPIAEKRSWLI